MSQNSHNRPQTNFQTLKSQLRERRCWPDRWDIRTLTREHYDNFSDRHRRCPPAQCIIRNERPENYNVNIKVGQEQSSSSATSVTETTNNTSNTRPATPNRENPSSETVLQRITPTPPVRASSLSPIPPVGENSLPLISDRETNIDPLEYYANILGESENGPYRRDTREAQITDTEDEVASDFDDDDSSLSDFFASRNRGSSSISSSEEASGTSWVTTRTTFEESFRTPESNFEGSAQNEETSPLQEEVAEQPDDQIQPPPPVPPTQPENRLRANSTVVNTFLENAGLPIYNAVPADNDNPGFGNLSRINSEEEGNNTNGGEPPAPLIRSEAHLNLNQQQPVNNTTTTSVNSPERKSMASNNTFASEDIRQRTNDQRFEQLLTLHEKQAKNNDEMTGAINRLAQSVLNVSKGPFSADADDQTPLSTSFFGSHVDPDRENDIFSFVIATCNAAAKTDKEMSLMKKFKLINEADLPIWDKNKHPSCLNFLMNVYHPKLSRLPGITPFELTAFTYMAFDHSMKERIMRQTSLLGEYYVSKENAISAKYKAGQPLVDANNIDLKLGRLDFRTVKLMIYPQLAQTIQSGVLDLKVEAWNTSAGVALTDHFLEILMMTQINNSSQLQEPTAREMSMAFKELMNSLKSNDHLEVHRELSRNTLLCRLQAMKPDRLGLKVTVQEALKEIEDASLVAEMNTITKDTAAVTTEQVKCAAATTTTTTKEADVNFINRTTTAPPVNLQSGGGNAFYQQVQPQQFQPSARPMTPFQPYFPMSPYPPMAMTLQHPFFQPPNYANLQFSPYFNQPSSFQQNLGQNRNFGQKNYYTPRGKFFQDNRAKIQAAHSNFASQVATCNMATTSFGQEATVQTCDGQLEIDFDEPENAAQTSAVEVQGEVECSTINWRKYGFLCVKMRINTSKQSNPFVKCLLDCGSDISIIKPSMLQHHGVDKFVYPISNPVSCTGFNNSKSTLSNQVQLFTTLGMIKAKFMFFVGPPNMSNDCILGMDILDRLGIPKIIVEQCYKLKIPVEVSSGLTEGKRVSIGCQTDMITETVTSQTSSPTATKRFPTTTKPDQEWCTPRATPHPNCGIGWVDEVELVVNIVRSCLLDEGDGCDSKIKNKLNETILKFVNKKCSDKENNEPNDLKHQCIDSVENNNVSKSHKNEIEIKKDLNKNLITPKIPVVEINNNITVNENTTKIEPNSLDKEIEIKNDVNENLISPKEVTSDNKIIENTIINKNTTSSYVSKNTAENNTSSCITGKNLGADAGSGEINGNLTIETDSQNDAESKPPKKIKSNKARSTSVMSSTESKPIKKLYKHLDSNQKILLANLIDLDNNNKWDTNYSLEQAKIALINHSHTGHEIEDECRLNVAAAETVVVPANHYTFVKLDMPKESFGRNWSLSGFKKGVLEIPDRVVYAGNVEETAVYVANHADHPVKVHKGQRICKAILLKNVVVPGFEISDEVEKRKLVFSDTEIAEVLSIWEITTGRELCKVKQSPVPLSSAVTRVSSEFNSNVNLITKLEEASPEDFEKIKKEEAQYKEKRDQAFMELIQDLPKEIKNCFMRHKDRFDGDESSWRLMKIKPLVLPRQPNHTRHVKCSYRKRFTEPEQAVIDDFIVTSLARKLITRSNSNILSPLLIVPKPHGRGYRVCCDYRLVNQRVYDYNSHAIPEIQDIIAKVSNKSMHTCLDITSAYWRAPLEDDGINRETTAFVVTQGQFVGVYHWNVLPFGPKPAVSLFSRIMDDALRGLQHHGITYYLDDICCSSGTPDMTKAEVIKQHAEDLDRLFRRARATNLTFSIEKAVVGKQYIELVGLFLGNGEVRASKDTLKKMVLAQDAVDLDLPIKTFQSFLGLFNYSRKFIPHFSKGHKQIRNIKHHYDSIKKEKSKTPSEIAEVKAKGQSEIKEILVEWSDAVTATALTIPTAEQELEIHTDAAAERLGWVCRIKSSGRIVEFGSREFSDCEKRYTIMERELLALCEGLEKLKHYCFRSPHNHCYVDNQCAVAHLNSGRAETTSRALRFLLRINCTPNTSFYYVPTDQNPADCLSRDLKISTVTGDSVTPSSIQEPTRAIGTQAGPLDVSEVTRRRLETIHRDYGHCGQNKLTKMAKLMFPFMSIPHHVVKNVVDSCPPCVKERRLGSASAVGKMAVPSGPNEILHIDHFDPSGKDAIHRREAVLSCRDSFSKFTSLYACKGHSHSEICENIRNHIMLFGAPSKIRMDNALNSQMMRNLAALYDFELIPVPAHSPKTNGQVERVHSDIRKILPLTITNLKLRKDNWVQALPKVANILNSTPHTVTLLAPDQIQLGHSCLDILRPKLSQQWTEVAERIKAAQDKAARPQAGPFKETSLTPGQAIWVFPEKSPPVAAEVIRDLGKSVFVRKCDDSLTRHREINYDKERISIRL